MEHLLFLWKTERNETIDGSWKKMWNLKTRQGLNPSSITH